MPFMFDDDDARANDPDSGKEYQTDSHQLEGGHIAAVRTT
jgi:hypothetical protein